MIWEGQEVVFNDVNEFDEMSWEEYLDYMFGKLKEDKTLLVGVMDEDPFEHYGRVRIYKCSMGWFDGTLTRVKDSLRAMIDELRALSKYWNEIHNEDIDVEELLKGTDSYEAWKKYLKPLPNVEMLDEAVQERVGHGINAYGVLYRAQRVCHLYALGAKQVIINQEERSLAQAFAIFRCCNEMEKVGKVETEQDEDPAK